MDGGEMLSLGAVAPVWVILTCTGSCVLVFWEASKVKRGEWVLSVDAPVVRSLAGKPLSRRLNHSN